MVRDELYTIINNMQTQLEFSMNWVVLLRENLSIAIIRCDLAIVTCGKLHRMVEMAKVSFSVFSCVHLYVQKLRD